MTDEDTISLSRRKALGAIGTIGAAGALGTMGTFAQFSDTEESAVSFTAGGIDGTLEFSGSYNGNQLSDSLNNVSVNNVASNGNQITPVVDFEDLKPGDYGSLSFQITVQNNPAWVASCITYGNNTDGEVFEPEVPAANETDLNQTDIGKHVDTEGELADNLLLIPFYQPGQQTFFDDNGEPDDDWTPGDMGAYGDGTTAAFWNSREGRNDFGDLQPKTVREAAEDASSKGTVTWNEDDGLVVVPAPDGSSVEKGCLLLEGDLAGDDGSGSADDEQEVSPLQPGSTLSFGYDWHLPYTTGNECQGDTLTLGLSFAFSQIRHSDAPQFQNSYDPGNFTPN